MRVEGKYIFWTTALYSILTGFAQAQVNDASVDVFVGVEHSDNLSRSSGLDPEGERDETVYTGGLEFGVNSQSRSYRLEATGNVERRQYDNGLFDDETIGRLIGNFDWILLEEQLYWNLSANHGQQIVDPFQAITPENREDVTTVSTGPTLVLPIGVRTFLNAGVSQTEASYDTRPLDNSRLQGNLSLERQIAPTRTVSVNVGGSQVEYDEDQLLPEIDLLNASFGFVAETARNEWSIELGWNYFERGGLDGDGFLLDLALRREITESASLSLSAGSQYSTNGDIFRLEQQFQSSTPSDAFFDRGALDIQGFGDVFRNDYASIGYSQSFGRTNIDLSGSWRGESYETITGLDREAITGRVSVSRELSQTMSASVFASLSNRDYDQVDRADDDSTFGLSFAARLGRKLRLSVTVRHLKRDSDTAEFDYDETRADLTLSYAVL